MDDELLGQLGDASQRLYEKLLGWLDTMVLMLPNFILAVLVVLIFYFIRRIVENLLGRLLNRISGNEAVNRLFLSFSNIVIITIGIFVALGVLKLDKTVTSLLAGVGIIGLALGFAFQDAAANLISGIIMAVRSPINVGDIIETNDYFGTVKEIGLRATTIFIPEGQDVEIPNRLILQNPFRHYTINGNRRIDLRCGISYGDDLEKVEKLVLEAINKIPGLLEGKPVQFFYEEYGSSSINFVVRYWIPFGRQPEFLQAQSQGIKNIKKTFDENDITIPFPIRTLDFGIKGGEKLSGMLDANGKK